MHNVKLAFATVADSRQDFFARREALLRDELAKFDWLRNELQVVESGVIRSSRQAATFAQEASQFGAQSLVVHIPIWADPILTLKLWNHLPLPLLLLGNSRPETSSTVGILGAGGALDQIGYRHERVFDPDQPKSRRSVLAFCRAAYARQRLRGQTLGLFGGRSLGIFTAVADPAQWQRLFGVDILPLEQQAIIERAESLTAEQVKGFLRWFQARIGGLEFGENFNPLGLERQARSYLATRQLARENDLDFLGVKCQPELSDGYVSQCLAHMLLNTGLDNEGEFTPVVHACESDADGALSMQILHLITDGKPTALLDIRWLNPSTGEWVLANCGAMASAFYSPPGARNGLSEVQVMPHVFGRGGGGAYSAPVAAQKVTLARLCRRGGEYWMAILGGETLPLSRDEMRQTTYQFPQARLRTDAGRDFLETYGSNHVHMVAGDWVEELVMFCKLTGMDHRVWKTE